MTSRERANEIAHRYRELLPSGLQQEFTRTILDALAEAAPPRPPDEPAMAAIRERVRKVRKEMAAGGVGENGGFLIPWIPVEDGEALLAALDHAHGLLLDVGSHGEEEYGRRRERGEVLEVLEAQADEFARLATSGREDGAPRTVIEDFRQAATLCHSLADAVRARGPSLPPPPPERARAEIDRLRGLARRVLNVYPSNEETSRIAREMLGEQPPSPDGHPGPAAASLAGEG